MKISPLLLCVLRSVSLYLYLTHRNQSILFALMFGESIKKSEALNSTPGRVTIGECARFDVKDYDSFWPEAGGNRLCNLLSQSITT